MWYEASYYLNGKYKIGNVITTPLGLLWGSSMLTFVKLLVQWFVNNNDNYNDDLYCFICIHFLFIISTWETLPFIKLVYVR